MADITRFLEVGVHGRGWDYAKINGLPDDEFLAFHHEVMESYRKDGYWTEKEVPCWKCKTPIPGPDAMIKYFGGAYDPQCFSVLWKTEREREATRNQPFAAHLDRLVALLMREEQ